MCKKAGKLSVGLEMSVLSARSGKAHLFVVAADASDNTKEALLAAQGCEKIPKVTKYTKFELGRSIGKREVAVICVLDEAMAKKLEGELI